MKRATFPYVLLVLLVFAWSLPMLVGAISSEQKEEKGKQKAWSAGKGDYKGEHAKEHSMGTWAEKKQKKGGAIECLMTLKEKLQLEDEQVAQVKALLEAQKEEIRTTMENLKEVDASQEEFKKAIQEARTGFEAKMAKILTPEQAERYKELKTGFKKWRTKRPGEIAEKKGPLAGLNLTDEQKGKFTEITERYHQKQQELSKQMMEELKEVLMPEQIEEFEAMKAHHMQLRSRPSKAKELKASEPVE